MAPTGLYQRLSNYMTDGKEPLPELSTSTVAWISIAYILLYVLPFYLSPTTRPSPTLSRDAPSVIRARIRFVTLAVSLCSLLTIYLLRTHAHATPSEILRLLGWWPVHPPEILKNLLLTAILFTGPLFEKGICESGWRDWIRGRSLHETLSSWIGWRNYIAGPLTEELLFRSLLLPLHLTTPLRSSPAKLTLLPPLYFAIAHVHHFYEYTLTHPYTPLFPHAFLRTLFQFSYTTLFGWYASFLFLRTGGGLLGVTLVHAFCNWMGLPRVWGAVEAGAVVGPVGVGERGKEDGEGSKAGSAGGSKVEVPGGRLHWGWTVAYYAILVAGAVGFAKQLGLMTVSRYGVIYARGDDGV